VACHVTINRLEKNFDHAIVFLHYLNVSSLF